MEKFQLLFPKKLIWESGVMLHVCGDGGRVCVVMVGRSYWSLS